MINVEWAVGGSCDRVYYSPNDAVNFILAMDNYSSAYIKISNIQVIFDFRSYKHTTSDNIIAPGKRVYTSYTLNIPSVYGKKVFTIVYDINYYNGKHWVFNGSFRTDENRYFINVLPTRELNTSRFIAFLSRGSRREDLHIGDFIAQRIRQWNFETRTVGIEVSVPNKDTSQYVRNEIKNADAFIAIATLEIMTKSQTHGVR